MYSIIGLLITIGFIIFGYLKSQNANLGTNLKKKHKEVMDLKRHRLHSLYTELSCIADKNSTPALHIKEQITVLKSEVEAYDMVPELKAKGDKELTKIAQMLEDGRLVGTPDKLKKDTH